jgi:hypothetical protein
MFRGSIIRPGRNGLLLASLALVFAGCTAGNGEGLDAGGRPVSGPPVGSSDFQEIQDTIFTPICTACHVGANAPQGLRLDAANSYAMLVNVASAESPGTLRVNPGNPDASYIVHKIEGTAAVGVRMPANGPPYLPQDRIDLVRRWISAGAPMAQQLGDVLRVTSTVPAARETAPAGTTKLLLVFNADVDPARVSANSLELRDANDELVPVADATVPRGRPNVVEISLGRPLPAGSFQLAVRGDGPAPLADMAGHVLDGDGDGTAGGDRLIPFDVAGDAGR